MRKQWITSLGVILLWSFTLTAQQVQKKPIPFLVAASDNKTYILILDAPREMRGFNVYRKGEGENEFQLLNPEPIRPINDPLEARDILGDDFKWIAEKMKTEDHALILRRLRSDPGLGTVVSLLSKKAAQVLGRLFIDEEIKMGETYVYRVAYLGFDGQEFQVPEQTITLKEIKPEPPTQAKAEAKDSQAKIGWTYPPYAGKPEDLVVGFNIYRAKGKESFQKVNDVPLLRQEGLFTRTDRGLENGMTYTYYVTAVDFIGRESKPSNSVVVVPRDLTPPHVPTALTATPEEGKIILDWKMNLDLDLSHYDIYRGPTSQGSFFKINLKPIPADQPTFVDSNLVFGPYHFYKVRAVDKSGNESKFCAALPARPKDTKAPSLPASLTSQISGNTISLKWAAPRDTDLFGYYVYRGFERDHLLRVVSKPLSKDTLWYVDIGFKGKGLWPGKTYYYAVSAVDNARNESPKSVLAVKMPDTEAPQPPVDVRAKTTKDGKVEVGWQPSSSTDVGAYRIYRREDGQASKVVGEVKRFAFLDRAVVKGQAYSYQVSAVDTFGNESVQGDPIKVVPKSVYLAPPPTGVRAVVTKTGVTVTWKEVKGPEVLGYNLYRSDQPSGIYQKLNAEILRTTRYSDGSGKEGLYYQVVTVTTSGRENNNGQRVIATKDGQR